MSDNGVVKYRPGPGELVPFEHKRKELESLSDSGTIMGDPDIIRRAWEDIEQYAARFVWMCLTDI